jgi:uncharacterized ParB-like nuclease family protein
MLRRAPLAAQKKRGLTGRAPYKSIFLGGQMQTIVKTLFVGAILAIGTGTALAADSVVGTWKLNLAKSTFSPGPAPKSQTRIYAESAQGMTLTVKTAAADGKESTSTLTFKDDGKPYPASGNPDFDMVSVARVDALTVHSTQTKAGATVGTGVRTVSKDGKTLTYAQKGTHAAGGKYDDVSVYDRQ